MVLPQKPKPCFFFQQYSQDQFVLLLITLLSCQGLYQSGVNYHLAISGKSFAALCDHFPDYLPKVTTSHTPSRNALFRIIKQWCNKFQTMEQIPNKFQTMEFLNS